jgi:predicted ATP-dependent serine protease
VASSGICSRCSEEGVYCDAWEPFEPEPAPPPRAARGVAVRSLRSAKPGEVRQFGGALSDVLDGVELGRKVLVGGVKGVGKSTLVAELAARMGETLKGAIYWLDREMDVAQVNALFVRSGSPTDRVRWIGPNPDDPTDRPITWREALPVVGKDAAVIVIDSLQRWAGGDRDQTDLLAALRKLPCTVLVISHANKAGEVAGRSGNQHDVDAVVVVKKRKLIADKCRWTPTPREVRRAVHSASASKKDMTSS